MTDDAATMSQVGRLLSFLLILVIQRDRDDSRTNGNKTSGSICPTVRGALPCTPRGAAAGSRRMRRESRRHGDVMRCDGGDVMRCDGGDVIDAFK